MPVTVLEDKILLTATAEMVRDINPGAVFGNPAQFAEVNGTVFFSAVDGVNGYELWKSDGTNSGTTLVKDIQPGGAASNSNPVLLTNVNGTLFFTATDGSNGFELWEAADSVSALAPAVANFRVNYGTVGTYDIQSTTRNNLPRAISSVTAVFSAPVNANINSLIITGTGAPTLASYSGNATDTLTWTFNAPVSVALLTFQLAASGPNGITAVTGGAFLDGNGDTVAGDHFARTIGVLQGDFTDDGYVKAGDILKVNAQIALGFLNFADINGDGVIDSTDLNIIRPRVGTRRPGL